MDFSQFFNKPLFNKGTYQSQAKDANGNPTDVVYDDEADKIKRKRLIAERLAKMSQDSPQGQFVKNGDFIGYAGGATLGSALLQGLTGLASNYSGNQADTAQKELGDVMTEQNARQAAGPQGKLLPKDEAAFEALIDKVGGPEQTQVNQSAAPAPVPSATSEPMPPQMAKPTITAREVTNKVPNTGGATGSWDAKPDTRLTLVPGYVDPVTGEVINDTAPSTNALRDAALKKSVVAPSAGSASWDSSKPSAGAGRGGMGGPTAAQLIAAKVGAGGVPTAAPANMAAKPSAIGAATAPAAAAMPPVAAPTAAPAPQVAAPAQMPAQSPIGAATQVGTDGFENRTQAQANASLGARAQPTEQEQIAYWTNVMRTGSPEMKAVAQSKLAQAMGPKTKQYDYIKLDDGTVVAANKADPRDSGAIYKGGQKPLTPKEQAELGQSNDKMYLEVQPKIKDLSVNIANTQNTISKATRAIELLTEMNPVGGKLSEFSLAVQKAFGGEKAQEISQTLQSLALSDIKETAGSTVTDADVKLQLRIKAAYESGLVPARADLERLISLQRKNMETKQAELNAYQGIAAKYGPTQAGAASAPVASDTKKFTPYK